jgi:hypothetical protein
MSFITSGGDDLSLTVHVSFLGSMDNIRQALRIREIQDTSEIISALNAIVTRPLQQQPHAGFHSYPNWCQSSLRQRGDQAAGSSSRS